LHKKYKTPKHRNSWVLLLQHIQLNIELDFVFFCQLELFKDMVPNINKGGRCAVRSIDDIYRDDGFNEPTDTVVWSAIVEKGIDPYDTLLWNIFPFHPHKEGNPLTNRTPTEIEQELGWEYTKRLLELHRELGGDEPLMLAVGQKSADTMGKFGLSAIGLRHPANGGANLYRHFD
jgi:hypothetical protein